MSASRRIFRLLYHAAVALGRPVGGLRPRRIYDILGRLAFDAPEFQWFRNRWGHELFLSPYYHIDRNILIFGTYDPTLHEVIESLLEPGMTALDVGANLGEIALHMGKRVGATGAVYAFEPISGIFERLRQHVERNGMQDVVRAVPLALSDRSGEAEIAFAEQSADNQGLASIANLSDKAGPLRTRIRTMTLDEFVRTEGIERIDLIKVDIQGAEPQFLDGAAETLRRYRPKLLMEFSPDDLQHANLTSRDLALRVERHGYDIRPLRGREAGAPLRAATMPETFAAPNVLCTPRSS